MRIYANVLLASCLLTTPFVLQAQNDPETAPRHSTQRLYLKDGSYQMVTEYHLAGDHVHYYSADRAQFEDVPLDMVDLAATQKWNAERDKAADDRKAKRNADRAAVDAEVKQKLDMAQPEVAPNLRLPEKGYIWGLDEFQGKPELLPLVQPASEVAARDKARSEFAGQDKKKRKSEAQRAENDATLKAYIANAAQQPPLAANAKTAGAGGDMHLEGIHSPREFHVTLPVLYLRATALTHPEFVLERTAEEFKQQERSLGPPSTEALAGGSGKGFSSVRVETMPGGQWLKISFPADLPIGEYALIHILDNQHWDEHVWDFGVSPRAPENGEAITPETLR